MQRATADSGVAVGVVEGEGGVVHGPGGWLGAVNMLGWGSGEKRGGWYWPVARGRRRECCEVIIDRTWTWTARLRTREYGRIDLPS